MARCRSKLAGLALFVGLLGCGSSLPRPEFERFDARVTPSAADYPDVPAVVLMDRGELLLTADVERRTPIGRLRRHRRIKVLRPEGVAFARVEVPYDPGSGVFGFQARSVDPDGRIVDAPQESLTDTPHASGRRAKALQVPAVDVGSVIEWVYDLYVDDLRFVEPWAFQGPLPTARSEFAVVVPPGYAVDLRYSKDGEFVNRPPERFEVPEGLRFSWSESNLPAMFPEEGMPSIDLLAPRAHVIFLSAKIGGQTFEGFQSWDAVGAWFVSRMPNWSSLRPETVAEAQRVAGDAPSDEKALKILELIARDLPPEPGPDQPLWRARLPHPDAVLTEKRANPTSRGLLLCALLRAAGLPALPALFAYRDEDVLLPDLPTVYALDGVAAVIMRPDGPLILDPTDLTVSSEVPPPRLQGTRLIAIDGDVTQVVPAPRSAPEKSRTELEYQLELDKRGDLIGTLRATLTGAEAGGLRALLRGVQPEAYAEVASAYLRARGAGIVAESVNIADLDALRRPLTLSGTVKVERAIQGEGTELYVPIGRLLGAERGVIREVRRSSEKRGVQRQVEVRATLVLPEGWEPTTLPPAKTERWSGGQVAFSVRNETKRRLGFSRVSTETILEVPRGAYAAYRAYVQAVRAAEDQVFGIKRPAARELEY